MGQDEGLNGQAKRNLVTNSRYPLAVASLWRGERRTPPYQTAPHLKLILLVKTM
jgi:hypothetical protein